MTKIQFFRIAANNKNMRQLRLCVKFKTLLLPLYEA